MQNEPYEIRLGYACINTHLRESGVYTSRTTILKTAASRGIEYIQRLIQDNVDDLYKIIIFNEAHGIRLFRISSCLFPHLGNPRFADGHYKLDFVKEKLKLIGHYAKKHGHRLTMHPGQFVQLGSSREEVVRQSIIDLENHVKLLTMLGYSPKDGSVLILHGGGIFDDKNSTLRRWQENFLKLPASIRSYIALENDENNYGILDLLPLCEELNIPFCLDIFHNKVSRNRVPITKRLIGRIFRTWHNRQMIPKIHVSEQQQGLRRGAHSKTINRLPLYIFRLPGMFKTPLDIMLEVKDKEISVLKLYYRYFNIKMDAQGRIYFSQKKLVKN